jgi:hypothetical protein
VGRYAVMGKSDSLGLWLFILTMYPDEPSQVVWRGGTPDQPAVQTGRCLI